MKAMKKWLSLIGAAAMAFSLTILPGAEKVSAAPPEANVTVENVTGEVGETVTIPVTFTSAAKDVQGFQANFDYDESVLEFESGRIETEYTSGGNVIAVSYTHLAFYDHFHRQTECHTVSECRNAGEPLGLCGQLWKPCP